jgi:hypothetical protein
VELSSTDDTFTPEQTAILDQYYTVVYFQPSLFTDDTFQFNEVVRQLTEIVKELPAYNKAHDELINVFRTGANLLPSEEAVYCSCSIYSFSTETVFSGFLIGLRRWLVFDTIELICA